MQKDATKLASASAFLCMLDSVMFLLAEQDLTAYFSKFMIISSAKKRVTEAAFHKQGELVNIRSGVNIVRFDYLQLYPKQIS